MKMSKKRLAEAQQTLHEDGRRKNIRNELGRLPKVPGGNTLIKYYTGCSECYRVVFHSMPRVMHYLQRSSTDKVDLRLIYNEAGKRIAALPLVQRKTGRAGFSAHSTDSFHSPGSRKLPARKPPWLILSVRVNFSYLSGNSVATRIFH